MSLKFKPLAPEEIAVIAGEIRQKDGQILQLQLVLHIKNRETCSIRLDEAVGTDRWQDTFVSHSSSPICTVSIFFPGYGWVSKSDCGENPMNSLSLKPAFSDAFKRACYKWGIGRELFFLPEIIVGPEAVTSPIIDPNTREIIGIYDRIEVVTFDVNEVTGHPDLVVLKNKNNGKIIYTYDAKSPVPENNPSDIAPAEQGAVPEAKKNEKQGVKPCRKAKTTKVSVSQESIATPESIGDISDNQTSSPEEIPVPSVPQEPKPVEFPLQKTSEEMMSELISTGVTPVEEKNENPFIVEHNFSVSESSEITYETARTVISDCGASKGKELSLLEEKSPSTLIWLWERTADSVVKKAIEVIARENPRVNGFFVQKGIAV